MKIAYIVPGFGNTFYCQNCIQNLSLFKALARQNHEAVLVPMYIPFQMDHELNQHNPVFFGAINVYLKEYFKSFHHLPAWLRRLFNNQALLAWISKKSGTTDPKGLEKMTISVMQGEAGSQQEELVRLTNWLKNEVKPDIVHLSNALLIGIGVTIKQALGIPVFCTLQDEDHWLDKMEEPYASLGWQLIKTSADSIDTFVSVSHYYAQTIRQRLDMDQNKFAVLPLAVTPATYHVQRPSLKPMTIGFLSRISDSLGINTLLDAFDQLKHTSEFRSLRLKISGGFSAEDKSLLSKINKRLAKSRYQQDVDLDPDLYKKDINAFFKSLTVLSVPSPEPEASGLFLLESMAAGIPVVQPGFGGYAELIKQTGGGLTYWPNTTKQLATTLADLLRNQDKLLTLSQQGRQAVEENFSMNKLVLELIELYQSKQRGS